MSVSNKFDLRQKKHRLKIYIFFYGLSPISSLDAWGIRFIHVMFYFIKRILHLVSEVNSAFAEVKTVGNILLLTIPRRMKIAEDLIGSENEIKCLRRIVLSMRREFFAFFVGSSPARYV